MAPPPGPRRVVLLAPMGSELRPLVRRLSLRRAERGGLFAGRVGRVEVIATMTGIGTGRAARTAQRVLDSMEVDHLVVVGIAGGIGPAIAIGDLVVPERVIDLDAGTEYRPARLGDEAVRGVLATADGLVTDRDEFAHLERRGVVAIDMETAAVAGVCERAGCPWSVFRAISDRADDGSIDAAVFGLVGADGNRNLRAAALLVLTRPWRLPRLARLARGSSLATRRAASAAARALECL